MDQGLLTWLLEQAPVIVVMGVGIWWLAKRLIKSEDEKSQLAKDVIKLATLWESKSEKGSDKDETIIKLLTEIKIIVQK